MCLVPFLFSPPLPSCLFPAFLSFSLQLFISFLCLSSRVLRRREQTSLKYQKADQEASLVPPFLLTLPPSLTDKQKSEPAGLAAVYCLPSFLLSLSPFFLWRDRLLTRLDMCVCVSLYVCISVCYLVWHQLSLQEAIVFETQATADLGPKETLLHLWTVNTGLLIMEHTRFTHTALSTSSTW